MPDARLRPTLDLPLLGARLRPWQLSDAPALAEAANDRGIWQNLGDVFPHPYQREDADWYIGFVTNPDSVDIHSCIEVNGTAAGAISVLFGEDVHRRNAKIGYWLARPQWGRSIMTSAVRVLADYAFAHFDLVRIYAEVFGPNIASARVLEKSGFELEGRLRKSITKDGQTLDALLYALVR
ncbi:GCN5-related N-acetyltransferase [Hymenobacter roseosalivarius DSM 11622]|uniref:GCN5-related N-acetyltransferase n=1 Tax=Hymenobacter roseosalivarius DSM 11622 TaxID=645990 RepID=A0A1W1ULQ6_9BACT|nr:GNAT family protein [Hymenobacter roseosalivarius]SMB82068.1 GCN5-related N-acetyltransferase [Hymenobacter roseosalivarius DSM 11622]